MNDEFDHALRLARRKLSPRERPDRGPLKALAAAAFFAISALGFAASAILAPPVEYTDAARHGVQ